MSLAVCNYILDQLGNPGAFKMSTRKSLRVISSLNHSDIDNVLKKSPFDENTIRIMRAIIANGGVLPSHMRFENFETFCMYASKMRYMPTKDFLTLLPTLTMTHSDREQMCLKVPEIHPPTMKRISASGFVGKTDDGEVIFVQNIEPSSATSARVVFQLATYVLKWTSADPHFTRRLKLTELETKHEYSRRISTALAAKSKDMTYDYYVKILIPSIVENMRQLIGFITTNYNVETNENIDDEDDGCERCPICLDSLRTDTVILSCGHFIHGECKNRLLRPECPVCRTIIS